MSNKLFLKLFGKCRSSYFCRHFSPLQFFCFKITKHPYLPHTQNTHIRGNSFSLLLESSYHSFISLEPLFNIQIAQSSGTIDQLQPYFSRYFPFIVTFYVLKKLEKYFFIIFSIFSVRGTKLLLFHNHDILFLHTAMECAEVDAGKFNTVNSYKYS